MPECGLSYQQHRKRGQEPCAECRAEHAETQRAYRARHPQSLDAQQLRRKARERALADLARQYRHEYEVLVHAHETALREEQRRARAGVAA